MASTGLNEESVEKKFMALTNTQDSIQGLSLWIIHHKTHYAYIVELWLKVMKKSVKPSHRLTLLYLCNDVVQTCKRKKAPVFVSAFKPLLKDATALVRDAAIRPKVERIFNIWEERQVFEKDFVKDLRAVLDGKKVEKDVFKKPFSPAPKERPKEKKSDKAKESVDSASTSSDSKDSKDGESADATKKSAKEAEKDDAPSEETLAAFKPVDLIGKMQLYKKRTGEVETSVKKVTHLKLDASSVEAIKHLKDREHGNEFSNDFEESCLRLEETAEVLEKVSQEQTELMAQLHIAEHFYSQQHKEARIVANAYKNYGGRISQVKKKLEELLKTLPSPEGSPSSQDCTPEGTPPHEQYEPSPMEYCPEDEGRLNGNENTPPSEMLENSLTGLDSRLSSFLPSLQSSLASGSNSSSSLPEEGEQQEGERPIPVYIPQPIHSNGGAVGRGPSANHTLTDAADDDPYSEEGGSTPLTDEPPTTPVMDEEPDMPPSPPPPPPPPLEKRKENPIDFLSRLISQTQKNGPQPSGGGGGGIGLGIGVAGNSFLANITQLTSQLKDKGANRVEKEEEEEAGGSPRPKCWAEWKAEKAVELATRVEPPPNTSVPPPLIPGLIPGPLTSLGVLGLPPPPLPLSSLPLIRPPSVSLARMSLPPRPALPVVSVPPPPSSPLAPLIIRAPISPMSAPSLTSPSSLMPVGVRPPRPGAPPSSPSLPPPGLRPHPLPAASLPLTSPPPAPQLVSSIKSIAPISPRGVGVVSTSPAVPSPSPNSSYFEHTSPGQKENWPEAGDGMDVGEDLMSPPLGMDYAGAQLDMPFLPVGMRSRGSNSVLKELTPSTEDMETSSMASTTPPPPESDSKGSMEEGCAISTLASSPSRGGPSFLDKVKQKHPSTYAPNPNLMTLTQGGDDDDDMDDDDDEEDEEDEEEDDEEEEEKKNGATRIPVLSSVVRRVDPREKMQQEERHRDRDSKYVKHPAPYPSSSSRRDRRYGSRENSHDSYSASYSSSHRERRAYDYADSGHTTEYSPYSDELSDDRGYDAYPSYRPSSSSSSSSRQKYGISQSSSSHRSYRH